MPGVSRSGITITAGRFLKLDRDSAARLSFLLLIPVTFGAVLYKGLNDVVFGELPSGSTGPFVVGMIASAGAGLIAIELLLGYVRRNDYSDLRRLPPLPGRGNPDHHRNRSEGSNLLRWLTPLD